MTSLTIYHYTYLLLMFRYLAVAVTIIQTPYFENYFSEIVLILRAIQDIKYQRIK